MRVPAARILAVGLTTLMVITACGTDQGDPAPRPSGPVTTTVTSAGEEFEVVTDELAVIEFSIPADAVLAPIEVTVTPLATGPDGLARFTVEPAPTQLRKPAKITVRLPEGQVAPSGTSFVYEQDGAAVALPTQTSAGGAVLSHETTSLGYGELVESTISAQQDGGSGWYDMRQIECLVSIENLQIRIERARNYPFSSAESAVLLGQQYEATVKSCEEDGSFEERMEAERTHMREVACERYVDAVADAGAILSEDAKTLHALGKQLLGWAAIKQRVGADCDEPDGDLIETLQTEFEEFIDAYEEKLESSGLPAGYEALKEELNEVQNVHTDAALLGLGEAEDQIRDQLLGKLLVILRERAYASCRADDTQAYLIDLLHGGHLIGKPLNPPSWGRLLPWAPFTEEELKADVHLCATDISVEVFTSKPRLRDDLTVELGGGNAPGTHVTQGSSASGVTSTLRLSGELLALNCAEANKASKYAADELIIELDNVEIARLQPENGRFLATPEEIDVTEAFEKISRDPSLLNTYPLTVTRATSNCSGVGLPYEAELFSVDLEFDPVPVLSSVSASSSALVADEEKRVDFTLPYSDQGANLARVLGTVVLGNNSQPFDNEVSSDESVVDFDADQGSGVFKTTMKIGCSEAYSNPVIVTIRLLDEFDQESEERTTSLTVDYSACDA